jgi:hypothetical protein
MQHLLNILKLNTFHILYFLVQEISSASTDLIDINACNVSFFGSIPAWTRISKMMPPI